MSDIEVVSRERVYDGFIKVDEARLRFVGVDGNWKGPVKRVMIQSGHASAVLLYDREADKLLFVRQLRPPLIALGDPRPLEIVAGRIDPGESAEEAARREVLEEIGHALPSLTPVLTYYASPGVLDEQLSIFYGVLDASTRRHEGGGDDTEDLELVTLTVDEAFRQLDDGQIRDAKTIMALQWLRLRGGPAGILSH